MFQKNSTFHVLYTTDIEATNTFYEKIGATIKEKADDKVVVSLADFDFHFILNTTEPFEEYKYVAKKTDYGNGILLYIGVDNLEDALELVTSAGGTIKVGIQANHWGARELLFEDPNGYKFVLYQ